MYEKAQVGPDLMDIFEIITLDDLFHAQLDPARNAHQEADIPLRSQPHYFFQLFGPVARARDLFSRFVKRLEPEGDLTGGNAAEIPGIITRPFLQAGAAADHQPALTDTLYRDIPIGPQGEKLLNHHDAVAAQQIVGYRDELAAGFGCAG